MQMAEGPIQATASGIPTHASDHCSPFTETLADGLMATRIHVIQPTAVLPTESNSSGTKPVSPPSSEDPSQTFPVTLPGAWLGDGVSPIRSGHSSILSRGALRPSTPVSGAFGSPRNVKRGMAGMLRDELTCPICIEPYRLPVTIPCGHTFCRYCIAYGRSCTEACPLCRTLLGSTLNINMVLHNLIKAMGFHRTRSVTCSPTARIANTSALRQYAKPVVTEDRSSDDEGTLHDDSIPSPLFITKIWWSQKLDKPSVPLQVFLRVLMHEIKGDPDSLFFDDLHCCCTDFLTSRGLWSPVKWMIGFEGGVAIAKTCGLTFGNEFGNQDALRSWVEEYVQNKPHTIAENTNFEPSFPGLRFSVLPDDIHGIQAKNIEGQRIMNKLPWAAGRHSECLVQLPHSSCSLFHFLVVPMNPSEVPRGVPPTGLGIVDLQSSIGTMIRIPKESEVIENQILHITYYLEISTELVSWEDTMQMYLDGETGFTLNPSGVRVWDVAGGTVTTVPMETIKDEVTGKCTLDVAKYQPIPLLKLKHVKPNMVAPPGPEGTSPANDLPLPSFWVIDPLGTAVGRGPGLSAPCKLKLMVTEANYYVSREHVVFYYGKRQGSVVPAWIVRDASSLGTFRKLQPFVDKVPLFPGQVLKVGQCKVEIHLARPPGVGPPAMGRGSTAGFSAGPIRRGADVSGVSPLSHTIVPSLLGYQPAGDSGAGFNRQSRPPVQLPPWAQPHAVLAPSTTREAGQPNETEGQASHPPVIQPGYGVDTGIGGAGNAAILSNRPSMFPPGGPTFAGLLAAAGSNAASPTAPPTRFSVPAPRMGMATGSGGFLMNSLGTHAVSGISFQQARPQLNPAPRRLPMANANANAPTMPFPPIASPVGASPTRGAVGAARSPVTSNPNSGGVSSQTNVEPTGLPMSPGAPAAPLIVGSNEGTSGRLSAAVPRVGQTTTTTYMRAPTGWHPAGTPQPGAVAATLLPGMVAPMMASANAGGAILPGMMAPRQPRRTPLAPPLPPAINL